MQFCPSLFEQDDPEFVTVRMRKSRLLIETRNVIVNDNFFPDAIFADFNRVESVLVLLLIHKQLLNSLRHLRQDT